MREALYVQRFAVRSGDLLGRQQYLERHRALCAGPSAAGPTLDAHGHLDEELSFRHVNYLPLLTAQRVRNNPQSSVTPKPIDFLAIALPASYLIYGNENSQLLVFYDSRGCLRVQPARHTTQDADGAVHWEEQSWRPGLPLRLFEDPRLTVPGREDRANWLSAWHTEEEWLLATRLCRYSNALIGLAEDLSPIAAHVLGKPGENRMLQQYERRRRELVQADFHGFASDHWNFNVRFPNPGGNHGGFLRISTHSVWMMAGEGLPQEQIDHPYDSLNFASTILSLLGHTPPMPDRVVDLR